MTPRIVVLGATGYTGGLVVESLARRGRSALLLGRDETKLRALTARHPGFETALADVSRPETLREHLRAGDVLVTTVGPFARFGRPAAEAAAQAGAHYLDSTGEVDFVRGIAQDLGATARENGSTMIPAFGFDYVPGMLAGQLAATDAGSAGRTLRIGYFMSGSVKGAISGGTRETMSGALLGTSDVWRDSRLVDVPVGEWTHVFTVLGTRRRAVLGPGTEVLDLPPLHPQITDLEVYNGWVPALSRAISGASRLAHLIARSRTGRELVQKAISAVPSVSGGPDAEVRAGSRGIAVAVVRDESGRALSQVTVVGPNTYTVTGELLAEGAIALAAGAGKQAGVLGPIQGLGAQEFEDLCTRVGLTAQHA